MRNGSRGEYLWLSGSDRFINFILTLLTLVPEAVAGRYVAVTAYDSGCDRGAALAARLAYVRSHPLLMASPALRHR